MEPTLITKKLWLQLQEPSNVLTSWYLFEQFAVGWYYGNAPSSTFSYIIARYTAEVGDLLVGRITEVSPF